jgi:integrase/recombinase XerD
VALGLDDIDWRAGLLRLPPGKSRRERVLPLSQEVGCALADYLWHGRPAHPSRRLFLTATKPPRGFDHTSAVTRIVQRSLRRAGIAVGRLTAAHMLRHTAASAMVNRGASFHQVADVLGHRSLATTGIYAKLDLDALAPVALPWSGGAQ